MAKSNLLNLPLNPDKVGYLLKMRSGIVGSGGTHPLHPAWSKSAAEGSIPKIADDFDTSPEKVELVEIKGVSYLTDKPLVSDRTRV